MNLTTTINRLMRYIARRGLKDAVKLIPSENDYPDEPRRPVHLPDNRLQLHLFGANFETQNDADTFCSAPPGTDLPSRLTQELDGAFIDEAEVEVIHDTILSRLLDFLSAEEADDIMLRLGGDNTLIIITENAFGDLPYTLDDTAHLTYLGHIIVQV